MARLPGSRLSRWWLLLACDLDSCKKSSSLSLWERVRVRAYVRKASKYFFFLSPQSLTPGPLPKGEGFFIDLDRARPFQDHRHGLQEDLQIESERPVVDVFKVLLDPIFEVYCAARIHLPQSG